VGVGVAVGVAVAVAVGVAVAVAVGVARQGGAGTTTHLHHLAVVPDAGRLQRLHVVAGAVVVNQLPAPLGHPGLSRTTATNQPTNQSITDHIH